MKAIWQMWKAELSDDIVQKIITECEYYDPVDAQIGFKGETPQTDKVRSSTVRWVTPTDTNSQFITDILWRYAARANRDVFGFDINESIVENINNCKSHINEKDLDISLKEVVRNNYLIAKTNPSEADVYIIAVPTPHYLKNLSLIHI